MGSPFRDEAEQEQYAEKQRAAHRANTARCPHCGTLGTWSYGGLSPAWLGNGNAKLDEFSAERTHWYGVPESGREHTIERCHEVLKSLLDAATSFKFDGPTNRLGDYALVDYYYQDDNWHVSVFTCETRDDGLDLKEAVFATRDEAIVEARRMTTPTGTK